MVREIALIAGFFFAVIFVTSAYRLDNINQPDTSGDQLDNQSDEDAVRDFRIQNNANVRNLEEQSPNNRKFGLHINCGKDCQFCKDECVRKLTGKEQKYCLVACKVAGFVEGGADLNDG